MWEGNRRKMKDVYIGSAGILDSHQPYKIRLESQGEQIFLYRLSLHSLPVEIAVILDAATVGQLRKVDFGEQWF
jgi:hypothetical protein